jgi:hypothetical protein
MSQRFARDAFGLAGLHWTASVSTSTVMHISHKKA